MEDSPQNTSTEPVISSVTELLEAPSLEVGRLANLDFNGATVLTTDRQAVEAGGIARKCFLLAVPEQVNTQVILLEVDSVNTRLETIRDGQRMRESIAAGAGDNSDPRTVTTLAQVAYDCSIVGTFYMVGGEIQFGRDLDRVLGYSMYRVIKPRGRALSYIASYSPEPRPHPLSLGVVRYSDTQLNPDSSARVYVNMEDFIGKKTSVLGMTRSGKSSTIKTVVQKVIEYGRIPGNPKVGQIIFDPQGEYANPNAQDEKSAIANVGNDDEVRIYRTEKPSSAKHRYLKFNLLDHANLDTTWSMMLAQLNSGPSGTANYIAALRGISFQSPTEVTNQTKIPYARKLLGLYALMAAAQFQPKAQIAPVYISLLDLTEQALNEVPGLVESKYGDRTLGFTQPQTALKLLDFLYGRLDDKGNLALPKACGSLQEEMEHGELQPFWEQIEQMRSGRNGVAAAFRRLGQFHNSAAKGDFREMIVEDLFDKGRLVIVDLSFGDSDTTQAMSEDIVNRLMNEASRRFRENTDATPFQIIVEEAHNLFSREGKSDSSNPWVRISKEASKYSIGLVYATQEVTSVDPRILSNTSNWIISHLNSKRETSELSNYYSFDGWGEHLRRVEEKGFVRLKTQSSPFIIPVQIDRFVPSTPPPVQDLEVERAMNEDNLSKVAEEYKDIENIEF
jgi:hypothetical protein